VPTKHIAFCYRCPAPLSLSSRLPIAEEHVSRSLRLSIEAVTGTPPAGLIASTSCPRYNWLQQVEEDTSLCIRAYQFASLDHSLLRSLQHSAGQAQQWVSEWWSSGAPSTTLATGMPVHWFQGCHTCSSVTVQKFCVIPSWWLSSCRRSSTESQTCVVTRTHSTFGDRAFAAASPGLWNSLPSHLRYADLPYSWFRRSLKTFLRPRHSVNYFNCAV